jgi:uncharacterized protein YaiE (UPF0345 family)
LSLVALAAGQVQIEGSPEWQAYKNAELAHIAPSVGPVAPVNYAQAELNHVSPSVGPIAPVNHAQSLLEWQAAQLAHQANAAALVAGHGRKKRQVQVVGSPEWQAYKNAELAHIAPSTGPQVPGVDGNWAQSQLNWLAAQQAIVAGHGRKKRQVQVVGSPEWQAYKNAELAHIAPSTGPSVPGVVGNWAQSQLNWIASQQAIVAAGAGRKKRQVQVVGSPEWQAYKNAELAHIAPSTGPQVPGVVGNWAQSQLNWIASQQATVAAGAGRKKRQATSWQENFVRPSQSWEANYHGQNNWQENFVRPSQSWEAAFVAGHGRRKRQTQAALDFVGPAPGPTAANFAQSALNFVAPAPGPIPVNFAQSSLDFVGPAPSNYAQAQLNFQQEALNFIARG